MESDYIIEDTDIRRLIVKAVEAREMAYARYSQFKVGAALLAGRENSSDADEVVGRETDSRDRNANEYRGSCRRKFLVWCNYMRRTCSGV